MRRLVGPNLHFEYLQVRSCDEQALSATSWRKSAPEAIERATEVLEPAVGRAVYSEVRAAGTTEPCKYGKEKLVTCNHSASPDKAGSPGASSVRG